MIFSNYHLGLNLLFLGKVVERVAGEQLQVFLINADILDPFHSSFHPGLGIETMLVALMDDLQKHLDCSGSMLLFLLYLIAVTWSIMTC